MNKHIKSLKKGLINVCNKLKQNNAVAIETDASPQFIVSSIQLDQQLQQHEQTTPKMLKSLHQQDKSRTMNFNQRADYATIDSLCSSAQAAIEDQQQTQQQQQQQQTTEIQATTGSSGYGTSITESAMSVFVNLDNYFYDENFAKIKDRAQETTQVMKLNVIQTLMGYQQDYLQTLKCGLENYVRPLSAIIDTDLYLGIFLNIEKIYTMAQFLRNTINESMQITLDLYNSTVTVIHEYISIIVTTFETFLKGYAQSAALLENQQFIETLASLNDAFVYEFDIVKFIELPIQNLTKLYSAFMSLLEMTPMGESHDYERINSICRELKRLIGPSSSVSLECIAFNQSGKLDKSKRTMSIESIESKSSSSQSGSSSPSSIYYNFNPTNKSRSQQKFVTSTVVTKQAKRKTSRVANSSSSGHSLAYSINKLNKKLVKSSRHSKHAAAQSMLNKINKLPCDFISQDGKKYYFI